MKTAVIVGSIRARAATQSQRIFSSVIRTSIREKMTGAGELGLFKRQPHTRRGGACPLSRQGGAAADAKSPQVNR
jgi:hypothetical protein